MSENNKSILIICTMILGIFICFSTCEAKAQKYKNETLLEKYKTERLLTNQESEK